MSRVRWKSRRRMRNSGYSEGGASMSSNALKSYRPRSLSPSSDIDLNLELLRNRAADLARNTPLGSAVITTLSRAVIGSGLRCFPRPNYRALGIDAEYAREWSRKVSAEFELWASTSDCDIYRRDNFSDLQKVAFECQLVDGDCFCLFRRKKQTKRNPYTLRLQLIEANRVSTPMNGEVVSISASAVEGKASNGNRIISGIEIDRDGAIRAVYVTNRVPNDISSSEEITEWQRVEAFGSSGYPNLLQLASDSRAGQIRGEPILSPVIESLKQLNRYIGAELTSAIIRSYFSVFFVQPATNLNIEDILERGNESYREEEPLNVADYSLAPGSMNALPRGVDVKSIDSSKQSAFESFVMIFVKQISAAVGVPYEVLLKNFTTTYSASRAALLQFNDEVKRRRSWFIRDFTRPVYEMWLTEAVAAGRIEAPGFFGDPLCRASWTKAEWYGNAISILDPLKEQQASDKRVSAGISTRRREAAEMSGSDFEENVEQLRYEERLLEELRQNE